MKNPTSKFTPSIGGGADRGINPPAMQTPTAAKNPSIAIGLSGPMPKAKNVPKPKTPQMEVMVKSGTVPGKSKPVVDAPSGKMPKIAVPKMTKNPGMM